MPGALDFRFDWLMRFSSDTHVVAIGHRSYTAALCMQHRCSSTQSVRNTQRVRALAPLHPPHNLLPVRTLAERRRKLPQVAKKFGEDVTDDICNFLLTFVGCASPAKINASFSGAEVGCQGEVGSASLMSATGLCDVSGRDRRPGAQRRSDGT